MLVSKHNRTTSAYACEFLLHEGTLHLLLAEEGADARDGALRLLNYSRQVLADCA